MSGCGLHSALPMRSLTDAAMPMMPAHSLRDTEDRDNAVLCRPANRDRGGYPSVRS